MTIDPTQFVKVYSADDVTDEIGVVGERPVYRDDDGYREVTWPDALDALAGLFELTEGSWSKAEACRFFRLAAEAMSSIDVFSIPFSSKSRRAARKMNFFRVSRSTAFRVTAEPQVKISYTYCVICFIRSICDFFHI